MHLDNKPTGGSTRKMASRAEQIIENDRNFTLFITLPNQSIVTLRKLSRCVTIAEIRDQLELQAGLACQTYRIILPGGKVLQEPTNVNFGKDIKNGAILKVVLDSLYQHLYSVAAEHESDADAVYRAIVITENREEDEDGEEKGEDKNVSEVLERKPIQKDTSNAERSLVLLFLASYYGHREICRTVINFDPEAPQRTSLFGRTAFHVAAANDRISVVNLFITRGYNFSPQDIFNKTPLEYCKQYGAFTCERLLRFKVLTASKMGDKGSSKKQRRSCIKRTDSAHAKSKVKSEVKVDPKLHDCTDTLGDTQQQETESQRTLKPSATPRAIDQLDKTLGKYFANNNGPHAPNATPRNTENNGAISVRERGHNDCYKRPAFVALCKIPLEEQRLVTVEFKPMERPLTAQSRSSGQRTQDHTAKHAWAEKVVRLKADPSKKKRSMSAPAQYYRTKYHKTEDEIDYKERPSTATTRFRFWKTWLIEKEEQEQMKQELSEIDKEKGKATDLAYRRWLAKKEKERKKVEKSSESESSGDEGEPTPSSHWPSPREQAYKTWIDGKRTMIIHLAQRKRREEEKAQKESEGPVRKEIYGRRLTCYEIGCTDPTPIKHPPVNKYIRDYKNWQKNKERFEAWKSKKNIQTKEDFTPEELDEARRTFYRDGMTYGEWLGMKHRQAKYNKQ